MVKQAANFLSKWWANIEGAYKVMVMLAPVLLFASNHFIQAAQERKINTDFRSEMSAKMIEITVNQAIDLQEHQMLFDRLNVPYWRSDSTGKTIYASPKLLSMVGLPWNRVMNYNWIKNTVVESQQQDVREQVDKTVADKSDWYCEFKSLIYHKFGENDYRVVDTVDVISEAGTARVNGRIHNYIGFIHPKEPNSKGYE